MSLHQSRRTNSLKQYSLGLLRQNSIAPSKQAGASLKSGVLDAGYTTYIMHALCGVDFCGSRHADLSYGLFGSKKDSSFSTVTFTETNKTVGANAGTDFDLQGCLCNENNFYGVQDLSQSTEQNCVMLRVNDDNSYFFYLSGLQAFEYGQSTKFSNIEMNDKFLKMYMSSNSVDSAGSHKFTNDIHNAYQTISVTSSNGKATISFTNPKGNSSAPSSLILKTFACGDNFYLSKAAPITGSKYAAAPYVVGNNVLLPKNAPQQPCPKNQSCMNTSDPCPRGQTCMSSQPAACPQGHTCQPSAPTPGSSPLSTSAIIAIFAVTLIIIIVLQQK